MGNRSLTDCCTLEGEGVDRITLVLSSEDEAAVGDIVHHKRVGTTCGTATSNSSVSEQRVPEKLVWGAPANVLPQLINFLSF